jgi:hypothetical protein
LIKICDPDHASNPIPAAEMIHETLLAWRSERAQAWWRRVWRWIFSA